MFISSASIISLSRMTILIKAKLKKLDDQTNIDKFRVAANITNWLFGFDYRIALLFKRYLVSIRIIQVRNTQTIK